MFRQLVFSAGPFQVIPSALLLRPLTFFLYEGSNQHFSHYKEVFFVEKKTSPSLEQGKHPFVVTKRPLSSLMQANAKLHADCNYLAQLYTHSQSPVSYQTTRTHTPHASCQQQFYTPPQRHGSAPPERVWCPPLSSRDRAHSNRLARRRRVSRLPAVPADSPCFMSFPSAHVMTLYRFRYIAPLAIFTSVFFSLPKSKLAWRAPLAPPSAVLSPRSLSKALKRELRSHQWRLRAQLARQWLCGGGRLERETGNGRRTHTQAHVTKSVGVSER